ncbi:dopamine D2-like receptor [Nematostella vectensis]|uniref:dopamine D2-like receptor n=1 Tax=Nematostella vectensis TaxID=45351 RepID=UPI00207746C9|nr:dopamine D2-like receptor [Nematostella vectensis]
MASVMNSTESQGISRTSLFAIGSFEVVIFFMGTIGNLLPFIAVMRNPRLRFATNYYVVSLSVADLLVTAILVPVRAVQHLWSSLGKSHQLPKILLDVVVFIGRATILASFANLALMSVDRLIALKFPLRYRTKLRYSAPTSLSVIFAAWFLSIFLTIIGEFPEVSSPRGMIEFSVFSLSMTAIIVVSYCYIFVIVRRQTRYRMKIKIKLDEAGRPYRNSSTEAPFATPAEEGTSEETPSRKYSSLLKVDENLSYDTNREEDSPISTESFISKRGSAVGTDERTLSDVLIPSDDSCETARETVNSTPQKHARRAAISSFTHNGYHALLKQSTESEGIKQQSQTSLLLSPVWSRNSNGTDKPQGSYIRGTETPLQSSLTRNTIGTDKQQDSYIRSTETLLQSSLTRNSIDTDKPHGSYIRGTESPSQSSLTDKRGSDGMKRRVTMLTEERPHSSEELPSLGHDHQSDCATPVHLSGNTLNLYGDDTLSTSSISMSGCGRKSRSPSILVVRPINAIRKRASSVFHLHDHTYSSDDKRTAKAIAIVISSFILLVYPRIVLIFYHMFRPETLHTSTARLWLRILIYTNSVMNPILYAWRMEEFRREFKHIFIGCFRKLRCKRHL